MESGFLIWVATRSGRLSSWAPWGTTLLVVGKGSCFLTVGTMLCRFNSAHYSNMPAKKDTASFSAIGQGGKGGRTVMSSRCPNSGKPIELLNDWEFREGFFIPNGDSVQLVEGDLTSIEKAAHNTIFFSKEQFNAGLRFSLLFLFKQFLHYTQIPPAYIHPNIVRVLMGCSILNMLFHLDLFLLEVLLVYTIKNGKKDIFSMFAHIPSLQLVMGLPELNKGGARGHVLV